MTLAASSTLCLNFVTSWRFRFFASAAVPAPWYALRLAATPGMARGAPLGTGEGVLGVDVELFIPTNALGRTQNGRRKYIFFAMRTQRKIQDQVCIPPLASDNDTASVLFRCVNAILATCLALELLRQIMHRAHFCAPAQQVFLCGLPPNKRGRNDSPPILHYAMYLALVYWDYTLYWNDRRR